MELSDISQNDNQTKEFILALCNKGITFRAFNEYFNTESKIEKELLFKCLDMVLIYDE